MNTLLSHHKAPRPDPCPQTRLVEFGSGSVALWWALLLLLPLHLFSTNVAFHDLPRVAPEWEWGLVSLWVGMWQIVSVLRRHPLARWLGMGLSASLWGGVWACLAAGSHWEYHLPINTGCGPYGVAVALAFACGWMLSSYALADVLAWDERRKRHKGAPPNTEKPNTEKPNTEKPNTEKPNTEKPNEKDPQGG